MRLNGKIKSFKPFLERDLLERPNGCSGVQVGNTARKEKDGIANIKNIDKIKNVFCAAGNRFRLHVWPRDCCCQYCKIIIFKHLKLASWLAIFDSIDHEGLMN